VDPTLAFALGAVTGAAVLAAALSLVGRRVLRRAARALPPRVPPAIGEALVWSYRFPDGVWTRVREAHPELRDSDLVLLERGLREWFTLAVHARGRSIGMPSVTVDWAWHEFVLHGAAYRAFCDRVLGVPFDHRPATTMDRPMADALEDARSLWERTGRAATGQRPVLWRCDREILGAAAAEAVRGRGIDP